MTEEPTVTIAMLGKDRIDRIARPETFRPNPERIIRIDGQVMTKQEAIDTVADIEG